MLLLIDNYDSFTYNLWHYLCELGATVEVVRNDKITVEEIVNNPNIDGVVISPGPCTPNESGVSLELLKDSQFNKPVLGVCLGHEAIGQASGAKIVRHTPMHGKVSNVIHDGKSVFNGLNSPFLATRYHSLIIEKEMLPDCLEVTARTEDGIIMGVVHKTRPLHGVQFHPESIASEHGHDLLKNFLEIVSNHSN